MDNQIISSIQQTLESLESTENVVVLLAVESGTARGASHRLIPTTMFVSSIFVQRNGTFRLTLRTAAMLSSGL
jgi:hypothetical protein